MPSDKEIVENVLSKIECAVAVAFRKGNGLSIDSRYRALRLNNGFNTYSWSSRIDQIYILDLLIIGVKTSKTSNVIFDVSKELRLPGAWLSYSIDCGLEGKTYNSCEIFSPVSRSLFHMGELLRSKFFTKSMFRGK